jgi:hypothetical protein
MALAGGVPPAGWRSAVDAVSRGSGASDPTVSLGAMLTVMDAKPALRLDAFSADDVSTQPRSSQRLYRWLLGG